MFGSIQRVERMLHEQRARAMAEVEKRMRPGWFGWFGSGPDPTKLDAAIRSAHGVGLPPSFIAPAMAKLTGLTHELAFDGTRFCFESWFNAEAASTACRFFSTNFRKEHSAIMSKWNSTTWDQSKIDEQRDEIKAALRRSLERFCGLFRYGPAVVLPACTAVAYVVRVYNAFAGVYS